MRTWWRERLVYRIPERHRAFLNSVHRCVRSGQVPRPPDAESLVSKGEIDFDVRGPWRAEPLVFSTSRGVFLLDWENGACVKLLAGKFYGLTRVGDWWYAARSNNLGEKAVRLSDVSRFRIQARRVAKLEALAYGFPGEIHQIDAICGSLWIPHTGFNQILVMELDQFAGGRRGPRHYYAATESIELAIPRPSHLNSLFHDSASDRVYILAHNLTAHTGRPSVIYRIRRSGEDLEELRTLGSSAHNVFVRDGDLYYCDSERGALRRNGEAIFGADKLLRGLSVTSDTIIVGGSDISFDRKARYSSDVTLYLLSGTGELVARVDLPSLGNVYEIRQLRTDDHAMSAGVESPSSGSCRSQRPIPEGRTTDDS